MGPFWKWMVGFMAWGQLRFIETNTLSSVGHQPSFYEYKIKGDNIERTWSQNNKKYSSNLAKSSIVTPMSLSISVSSSYYSFIVVSDPPWTLSGAQMCGSLSEANGLSESIFLLIGSLTAMILKSCFCLGWDWRKLQWWWVPVTCYNAWMAPKLQFKFRGKVTTALQRMQGTEKFKDILTYLRWRSKIPNDIMCWRWCFDK